MTIGIPKFFLLGMVFLQEVKEQSHNFGGGASDSTINPAVLGALVLGAALILFLPRKFVILPILLLTFLVPFGQQLYIAGVHFLVFRIVVIIGMLRIAMGSGTPGEPRLAGGSNSIDRAYQITYIACAVGISLQYMVPQAAVNQAGELLDFLGGYYVARSFIRDKEDIYRALKCLAVIALVMSVEMVREQYKLQNLFGVLGGVNITPDVREGKIRSQGVFQHSIIAGTFAASLIPLFLLLWKNGKAKLLAAAGLIGATAMTYTSQSSTPLLTYATGMLGLMLWPIRGKMQTVRRGIVVGLILLQCVMKAPVWFIIAHIDLTGGSSGYHRAELVDQFIWHFKDWALIGTNQAGTWAYDLWDVQNQYVAAGENGGIIGFLFFIALVSKAYATLGNARKTLGAQDRDEDWFLWFIGCSLFATSVGFFGVNYFDQSKFMWCVLLAILTAATGPLLAKTVLAAAPVAAKAAVSVARKPAYVKSSRTRQRDAGAAARLWS
jgi:hypothetical protein